MWSVIISASVTGCLIHQQVVDSAEKAETVAETWNGPGRVVEIAPPESIGPRYIW